MSKEMQDTVRVTTFTGGLVGPSIEMLGPVADGGTIVAETAPGCWGPMITPSFRGGHEVTTPVAVGNPINRINECSGWLRSKSRWRE